MKLLSLFIFALLAFVKTSPPDIHSREVSSVENGRHGLKKRGIVLCNKSFIQCSEQKSICETIEEEKTKSLHGIMVDTLLCNNRNNEGFYRIKFINCAPSTGIIRGPLINLTEKISKYVIVNGKNYVTANNKEYVCASKYGNELMQFSQSSCTTNIGMPGCP
ncbi:hypothetical protein PPACK8108_LOCUS5352 [Phakopsora pachyrhizi]|uniref:Uncharacterized protein n=1 Tax=Phakopsora pachyrhizi TaxID=170000 RepID=A0AAV0AQQ3_PHAPC|nr:hypothetical protein PPACK8108_LOCUS5352 [Phakopsora pachyrhizi]